MDKRVHDTGVVLERDELKEKITKLGNFIFSRNPEPTIDDEEAARMFKQYAFMTLYLGILEERIAAFKE